MSSSLTDPLTPKDFPPRSLISYGFFFGWDGVFFGSLAGGFGWSGSLRWDLFKDNLSFPGNIRLGDFLSQLLQIEFDLSDSLFQGFVFVWHMFVVCSFMPNILENDRSSSRRTHG